MTLVLITTPEGTDLPPGTVVERIADTPYGPAYQVTATGQLFVTDDSNVREIES
jgi:hypothetical protein